MIGVLRQGTSWAQNGGQQGAFVNRKDAFCGTCYVTTDEVDVSVILLGIAVYFQIQPVS